MRAEFFKFYMKWRKVFCVLGIVRYSVRKVGVFFNEIFMQPIEGGWILNGALFA